jgi:hypothetical protein
MPHNEVELWWIIVEVVHQQPTLNGFNVGIMVLVKFNPLIAI